MVEPGASPSSQEVKEEEVLGVVENEDEKWTLVSQCAAGLAVESSGNEGSTSIPQLSPTSPSQDFLSSFVPFLSHGK